MLKTFVGFLRERMEGYRTDDLVVELKIRKLANKLKEFDPQGFRSPSPKFRREIKYKYKPQAQNFTSRGF